MKALVTDNWLLAVEHTGRLAWRERHPGGAQAAMADGSVRFFAQTITVPELQALATRADGEAVAD